MECFRLRRALGEDDVQEKIIVVVCGRKHSGRVQVAFHLGKYLNWIGYQPRIFNYHYSLASDAERTGIPVTNYLHSSDSHRDQSKRLSGSVLRWLSSPGHYVAILNSPLVNSDQQESLHHSIRSRWSAISSDIAERLHVLFVHCTTTNESTCFGEDSDEIPLSDVLGDWHDGVANNSRSLEEASEITLVDLGDKISMSFESWTSLIIAKITTFLTKLYPKDDFKILTTEPLRATVWILVHGQSQYNLNGRIGGDPGLSDKGVSFATKISEWFVQKFQTDDFKSTNELILLTSHLQRSKITGSYIKKGFEEHQIPLTTIQTNDLDEIHAGVWDEIFSQKTNFLKDFDGMSYKEIELAKPEEFKARSEDKMNYRYSGGCGESYHDLIRRLDAVVLDIELLAKHHQKYGKTTNILVVAHQAVVRTLYAYFSFTCQNEPRDQIPFVNVSNKIFQFERSQFGWKEYEFSIVH